MNVYGYQKPTSGIPSSDLASAVQTSLGKADTALQSGTAISTVSGLQTALDTKQATLVSATNIKTVNSTSLLGSGDIVISSNSMTDVIRSTDGNLSASVNTWYHWDISGLTAERTLTLPSTAAVGDRVALKITTGDDTYRVVITAASGDTLDGIAGGTGWSGLFISAEVVIMRCIVANTTWVIEYDGRIACRHRLYRTAISPTAELVTSAWTKLSFTAEENARGDTGVLGSNQVVMRRSGVVTVTVCAAVANLTTLNNPTLVTAAANIGGTRYEFARDTWHTNASSLCIVNNTITKPVTVGTVIYAEAVQYNGADREIGAGAYLEVIEQL